CTKWGLFLCTALPDLSGRNLQDRKMQNRRVVADDVRLARQINVLCDTLTDVIESKESFVAELEMLGGKFVSRKMAEFIKDMLNKDVPNLMKLQILGREFELRATEKNIFIEKLKGERVASVIVAHIDNAVPVFLTLVDWCLSTVSEEDQRCVSGGICDVSSKFVHAFSINRARDSSASGMLGFK
nr:hypothetical protein [Tanacetum cinerariifolium]